MRQLPEYVNGMPNISGSEKVVLEAANKKNPGILQESSVNFGQIKSAFGIALHMQQPLIPAGGPMGPMGPMGPPLPPPGPPLPGPPLPKRCRRRLVRKTKSPSGQH